MKNYENCKIYIKKQRHFTFFSIKKDQNKIISKKSDVKITPFQIYPVNFDSFFKKRSKKVTQIHTF